MKYSKKDYFYLLIALPLCVLVLFSREIISGQGLLWDTSDYSYPLIHYFFSSIKNGVVPLWNPYIYGGTPYQADPQTYFFYPFMYLLWFLPAISSIGWSAIIHLRFSPTIFAIFILSKTTPSICLVIGL